MAAIIVFFALIILYICFIPVKIALHLYAEEKIRFAGGAAVFDGRHADKRAERKARAEKKKPGFFSRWLKSAGDHRRTGASLASLRHFLRHVHIEDFSAVGTVSLSDAAKTAMVCGASNALSACLKSCPRVRIDLRADFSSGRSRALIRGMLSIRAGHIIYAAILGIAHYIKGGFAQWKNTRSKAS